MISHRHQRCAPATSSKTAVTSAAWPIESRCAYSSRVAAMKFIVMVLTLYLVCENVQADVAASGLNSVGPPDVAPASVSLLLFNALADNHMRIMLAQRSCKQ